MDNKDNCGTDTHTHTHTIINCSGGQQKRVCELHGKIQLAQEPKCS